MFRSQSSDHHQGLIIVHVQLLRVNVPASSYSSMWLYVVCTCIPAMCLPVLCLIMYSI